MVGIDDASHGRGPESHAEETGVHIHLHLPAPGSPPRSWDTIPAWIASTELDLIVQISGSAASLHRLADGQPLNDTDEAALGRLNFAAHLNYFMPVVALMPERQILDPTVARLLQGEPPVSELS